MRLKNIIWKTVVMSLMASPLCISCDDDDEVTMNSKFYLSTKVFPVDSYEASLSVILKDNSVVVNELQPNYRFVACATERLSKDVKITADSDDNLVSAYNKANDTEYNILPAENYSFSNKTVTIENGESVSGDSIKIELLNVGSLTTEGGYLLPVTISSIEGNNLDALSSNRGVVYLKIQNIHVNVESGQPAEGTLIADRSGWTVKVAPTTRGDAKNLIDGTNSDVARDGGAEYWLTVDIGKVQTLTGIRNKCYASSYSPTAVEVFTSSDGAKWKSIGAVTISKSGTQYIKFSKAVETRYLKYYVKQGPNTVSLTEFDLYAK